MTERTIVCRACDHRFDTKCSHKELPVACESCGSEDTYSEVGANWTSFRHNPGDTCGWAASNYTRDKVINLGDATPKERRDARDALKAQHEAKRKGTWVEPG